MARIAILTHEHDAFATREYLLKSLLPHWEDAGHSIAVVDGLQDWPDADLAILHVDHSLVPQAYAQACMRYARVINGRALDIRKRHVSRILLRRDSDWTGPVIIKTNLNHGGMSEMHCFQQKRKAGHHDIKPTPDMVFSTEPYTILPDKEAVNPAFWDHPGLVIEPFLAEGDQRGYSMRTWVFLGAAERSSRFFATDPLVKSANIVAREPCAIPDEIRAERLRLGFDYGKFDFVVHEGRPILLDANRTPFAPSAAARPDIAAANALLARGLMDWIGT